MSFLDNLENNLKALESLEQGGIDETKRREAERARALAAAPWAEKLKTGAFVQKTMQLASRAGHSRRIKVNLVWIGTTFRLEARGQRLELRPGADGVAAVFLSDGEEQHSKKVDLSHDPQVLVEEWMRILDEHQRLWNDAVSAEVDEEDL